jgi:hypothetical protein
MTLLVAALAVGEGSQMTSMDVSTVENPFAVSSVWELVWFEEDGKREKRCGTLKLDSRNSGSLDIFPRATRSILACRANARADGGTVDLDVEWEGEFPGDDTLSGIYTVRDKRLWLCFVGKGSKRPNGFTTQAGDFRTLLLFKRVK